VVEVSFFRIKSCKFREIRWDLQFSSWTNVFPSILILQMLNSFMNSNLFQQIFLACGARARNYEPSKNEHIFECCKKCLQQIVFLKKYGDWQKKYLNWMNFCKKLLEIRIWYYLKKRVQVNVDVNMQEYCNISCWCCCTHINHFLR